MKRKKSKVEEINDYIRLNGMELYTEKENYKNQETTIEIKCSCGELYETTFRSYKNIRIKGCNMCRAKKGATVKITLEIAIKAINSKEGNGAVFLYAENFKNSQSEIHIQCKCGNEFITTFSSFRHSGKGRCRKCISNYLSDKARIRRITPYRKVEEELFNLGYMLVTPKEDYVGYRIDYICKCGSGEIINQKFAQFRNGVGRVCSSCSTQFDGHSTIPYEEIKKEIESMSDCILITSKREYNNTKSMSDFKCKCGAVFSTTVHEFKTGNKRQCNKCGNSMMSDEEFEDLFKNPTSISDCKLLRYDSSEGYVKADSIVHLQCKCGSDFSTKRHLFTHRSRYRCERCSNSMSIGEFAVQKYLESNSISYKREYHFKDCRGIRRPLPFDYAVFLDSELFCLIEYDGKHHFEPVNFGGITNEEAMVDHLITVGNDEIKNDYCKDNDIRLIRIPYWDFNKVDSILEEELNEILNERSFDMNE